MPPSDVLVRRIGAPADIRDQAEIAASPENPCIVVTFLDPRVEPADFLGVRTGDANVMSKPGGRIEQTVADIALSSFAGEVTGAEGAPVDVAVLDHTVAPTSPAPTIVGTTTFDDAA